MGGRSSSSMRSNSSKTSTKSMSAIDFVESYVGPLRKAEFNHKQMVFPIGGQSTRITEYNAEFQTKGLIDDRYSTSTREGLAKRLENINRDLVESSYKETKKKTHSNLNFMKNMSLSGFENAVHKHNLDEAAKYAGAYKAWKEKYDAANKN